MRIVFLTIIVFISVALSAQPGNPYSTNRVSDKQLEYLRENNALFDLVKALEQRVKYEKNNELIYEDLAKTYLRLRQYEKAEGVFTLLLENFGSDNHQRMYQLALCMQSQAAYESSIGLFKQVYEEAGDIELKKKANDKWKACEWALKYKSIERNAEQLNEINSGYLEADPLQLNEDMLLFVSLSFDELIKVKEGEEIPLSKIHIAGTGDSSWQSLGVYKAFDQGPLNVTGFTFNDVKNLLIYSGCSNSDGALKQCNFYYVKFLNGEGSKPVKIKLDQNFSFVGSPEIAYLNGLQYLLFTGRKANGQSDLYYAAFFDPGEMMKVEKLNGKVNTGGDECCGFVYENQLYYSSDNGLGFGGMDVFRSTFKNGLFEEGINMGKGINSPADDIFFSFSDYGSGYVVSNRSGAKDLGLENCCDDIYQFDFEYDSYKIDTFFIDTIDENENLYSYNAKEKIYTLKNVFYAVGESDIHKDSYRSLNAMVQILKDNPAIIVEIVSHTDSTGNETENIRLSQKRADKIVSYLIKQGLDRKRLSAKGVGSGQPVDSNSTAEGRKKNRRTEFKILGELEESR